MIDADLLIVNRLGLHARAAAKLVATASSFQSSISISRENRSANAKSIMGVMMLAAAKGTTIRVEIDGEDEAEALAALEELVAGRFGEAE